MKGYIQYYQKSAISDDLISACGDRSVLILDGRQNLETWINDGYENNGHRRPKYEGFKVMKGDLRSSKEIYSSF